MNPITICRSHPATGRAYHRAMRRAVGLLLATITIAACGGGSDVAPPPLDTEPPATPAASREPPPPTVEPTVTEPPVSAPENPVSAPASEATATSLDAPTTTIGEAAILAEAEAAAIESVLVGLESIRNPDDPNNEQRLRDHFALNNLEAVLNNLELTQTGNFIAKENSDNPSFAMTYSDARFVNDDRTEVALTVCEFYTDRLFERGTAPDGGNTLIRDEPLTQILSVEMVLDEGMWRSARGEVAETVSDEVERCSTAS